MSQQPNTDTFVQMLCIQYLFSLVDIHMIFGKRKETSIPNVIKTIKGIEERLAYLDLAYVVKISLLGYVFSAGTAFLLLHWQ